MWAMYPVISAAVISVVTTLEIFGMTTNVTTPVLYALGTLTTAFSFLIIAVFLLLAWGSSRRKAKAGSDAGKGMV